VVVHAGCDKQDSPTCGGNVVKYPMVKKMLKIRLLVSTEYANVTDGETCLSRHKEKTWRGWNGVETNYPSLAYEQPQNSPVSPPEQKSISPFFCMP